MTVQSCAAGPPYSWRCVVGDCEGQLFERLIDPHEHRVVVIGVASEQVQFGGRDAAL